MTLELQDEERYKKKCHSRQRPWSLYYPCTMIILVNDMYYNFKILQRIFLKLSVKIPMFYLLKRPLSLLFFLWGIAKCDPSYADIEF